MPFYRFKSEDLYYNRIKTFPQQTFFIYDSKVYINNFKHSQGDHGPIDGAGGTNHLETIVPQGFISLYELNVEKSHDPTASPAGEPPGTQWIYPFITKDGSRTSFRTIETSDFDGLNPGQIIKGNYPLSASIKRTFFEKIEDRPSGIVEMKVDVGLQEAGYYHKPVANRKYLLALKNTFDKYIYLSRHYAFNSSSISANIDEETKIVQWDKGQQELSLIEIPSIFYGSSIKKGSVSLKYYVTGALAGELRDVNKNGELLQVSGSGLGGGGATPDGNYDNQVAGVVLYNEGFIALTGSWALNCDNPDGFLYNPVTKKYTTDCHRWLHFGFGANEQRDAPPNPDPDTPRGVVDIEPGHASNTSFSIDFEGVNYVPTVTMMAHAPRGRLNNSMNPTYIERGQYQLPETSSLMYKENDEVKIKNLEYTPYMDPTGSFVKQVYISKIGIYDKDKNLIGIAKLANPVRKTENRDYTFKLKYDF